MSKSTVQDSNIANDHIIKFISFNDVMEFNNKLKIGICWKCVNFNNDKKSLLYINMRKGIIYVVDTENFLIITEILFPWMV